MQATTRQVFQHALTELLCARVQRLRGYLAKEHEAKKKAPMDFTGWEDFFDEVGQSHDALIASPTAN